jgi:uncharacterized protein (TIGR03437 family)
MRNATLVAMNRRQFLSLPFAAALTHIVLADAKAAQKVTLVRSAASETPLERLALGSLVMIEGTELRAGALSGELDTGSFPQPRTYDGLRVEVGGVDAPIFYADEKNILIQVPFDAGVGTTDLKIIGDETTSLRYEIVKSSPTIFTRDGVPITTPYGDNATLNDRLPRTGEWWMHYTTGADREWAPIKTGEPSPVQENGDAHASAATIRIGSKETPVNLVWTPGQTGTQYTYIQMDHPRGVHELQVLSPNGNGPITHLPVRADDEPLLEGIVTATDVAKKQRAYNITITDNAGTTQEAIAPAGRYLTYFPGKPTSGTVIDPLRVRVTSDECYPHERTHDIGEVRDTELSHIMIPRLTDPRETLRLNPDATNQDFWRNDMRYMFLVDPTAALDTREYLIAGWKKGLIEMFDPEYATKERLELRPVSMYNGRWMQQLPFKVYLNPDGASADIEGSGSISLVPSTAAVDAAAEYMLSWNKAFPQPVIQIVDYDPTKREGEQGTFVLWGLTGNGADFRIRASDRSEQSALYINFRPEIPVDQIGHAAAHELGHLVFGLAHRLQRGIMRGVGSAMTDVPDPIELLAARTNFSFPGQFDHLGDRLARVGYDPTGALGYDQPYFHGKQAMIDRPSWYKE